MSEANDLNEFVYGSNVALGWGCFKCRVYNGLQREHCKSCGAERGQALQIPPQSKQGIYCEEGGETRVQVVHVWFEKYTAGEGWTQCNLRLKSLTSLREGHFGEIKPGTEFTVGVNVEYVNGPYRGWSLDSDRKTESVSLAALAASDGTKEQG